MMEEAQKQEELDQIACWLQAEGVAPDAPMKDQLCFLWSFLQHRERRLVTVTHDLDTMRSRHSGEMTEVQRSLEQIRTLTEEKDVLAQEIQQENDQLRVQLHRLMLQQDAQINEVAEMLYQEGLAEVIHSNPSEQVAYLLAERASLLERNEGPDGAMSHGDTPFTSQLEAEAQRKDNSGHSLHKGAAHRGQSPWKRLFGLRKAAQSKHTFIPAESRQLSGQAFSMERECAHLERDLEEASRRLAMAHKEIRRLTDELESARLTQSAYEPELQGTQQEVEQLRQQVENLKKRDVVELRKAKEFNDRLDQEIRALRTRVRALDAERRSLQETVVSLETEVGRLGTGLQDQQQKATQQLLTVQAQNDRASELAKSQVAELAQSRQTCRHLQEKLMAQMECLQVHKLQQQVENSDKDMGNLSACVCTKDNEERLWEQREADLQQEVSSLRRLESSLARRDEECKQLVQDVQRTQSLLSVVEQQVALLTEDKLNLQRDITRLQQDNANIHAELEEEHQRSRELKERLAQSSQDAHNNSNNNHRLKDQLSAERTLLVAMETEIEALRQQLKASEQQLQQERSCSVESSRLEGDNRNCLSVESSRLEGDNRNCLSVESSRLERDNRNCLSVESSRLEGDNRNCLSVESRRLEGDNRNCLSVESSRLEGDNRNCLSVESSRLEGDNRSCLSVESSRLEGDNRNCLSVESSRLEGDNRNCLSVESSRLEGDNRNCLSVESSRLEGDNRNCLSVDSSRLERDNRNCLSVESSHLEGDNRNCLSVDSSHLERDNRNCLSVESSHLEGDNRNCLATLTNQAKEHKIQRRLWEQREVDLQQEMNSLREVEASLNLSNSELSHRARTLQTQLELIQSKSSTTQKVSLDYQEVAKHLLASQDECEKLKDELCEALKSLDTERSKYHRKNEQHKGKLHRAKQKFGDETKWRDEKMRSLERELSLSMHSSAKMKQLLVAMNEVNEKLLFEKRNLLKQLNEEEEMKKNSVLEASLSKRRVGFLEEENRKQEDRMLQLSNQLALLERTLRNVQSLHCAEEMKKMSNPASVFLTSSPLQRSRTSMMMPGSSDMRGLLDMIQRSKTEQSVDTTSPLSTLTMPLSWPTEMGYLNLTSPNSRSDCLVPSDSLSSTDSDEA